MRSPMRRALNSKDLDRGAASKRAQKGRWMYTALCAGHHFPKIQIVETASKRTHHKNNFSHAPLGRNELTKGSHVRSPMRRALISKDLDRGAASKRAQKTGGGERSPMRGTPFSQDIDREDGIEHTHTHTHTPLHQKVSHTSTPACRHATAKADRIKVTSSWAVACRILVITTTV